MKFVKEEDEERRDYILQKDRKTKFTARFTGIVLAILILGLVASYYFFSK